MIIKGKKRLVFLLVLIMALAFVGCDGDSDSDDKNVQEDVPQGDIQVELSIDFPDGQGEDVDDKIMALPYDSSVLDLLWAYANDNNLNVVTENDDNPYVKTIGNLSAGTNSGWVFTVNDDETTKSASEYMLSNGDEVEWEFIKF